MTQLDMFSATPSAAYNINRLSEKPHISEGFSPRSRPPDKYPNSCGWKEITTSRDAAIAIEASGVAQLMRERVLEALRASQTAKEIAFSLGADINSVRPRISELKARGLIRESGERRDRQHVWRLG